MIKKFFSGVIGLFFGVFMQSVFASPAIFAQLASTADQLATPDTVNQPKPVILQTIDSIYGMEWDNQNNRMLIKKTGVYVILSDVQVGARESATNIIKGGDIYYWLEQNGVPIPNSGNWVFASPNSRAKTIDNVWVMPLKADDYLQFMFSSTAPSMGLLAIPPKGNIPNSPGLTLTMFMLPDELNSKPQ